jgi:hypothetical protein
MRPKQDIHCPSDNVDSPGIYTITLDDEPDEEIPADHALAGQAAAVEKLPCAPGRDERKSVRSQVPEARRSCELKIGADVLPALLVDESRGGFAVLIDHLDGLKSGKKAKLHTDMGWFQVRIVYIRKTARPSFSNSKSDTWLRLGLRKKRSFFLF